MSVHSFFIAVGLPYWGAGYRPATTSQTDPQQHWGQTSDKFIIQFYLFFFLPIIKNFNVRQLITAWKTAAMTNIIPHAT